MNDSPTQDGGQPGEIPSRDKIQYWRQLLQSGKLPKDFDLEAEAAYLTELSQSALSATFDVLDFQKLLGAGGSGTVFLGKPRNSQRLRAVKIPRKSFADDVRKSGGDTIGAAGLDVEVSALDKLFHPNIVRLHEAVRFDEGLYVLIMTYVADCQDLDKYLDELVARDTNGDKLDENVRQLSRIMLAVTDALSYMHDVGRLYHFDIKPSNILVDPVGTPYITDLGFARDPTTYQPDDPVMVGFTWRYAHPRLRDPYSVGARVSKTPAKCKAQLHGRDLGSRFDLFALGRTLQECLAIIEGYYRDRVHANYTFNFLHLVACFLLDGTNTSAEAAPDISSEETQRRFASDIALRYPPAFFRTHKFDHATQVLERLRRLEGMVQIEAALPEMDPWYPKIVNASDLDYIPLTPRVEAVVNHPAFGRLGDERQLGLLERVYPTATHTRANHSLGSFLGMCLYLEALYRDPDVPTFKVVVDIEDLRRAMVSALIHDLGQTALGHDLEEINEQTFAHNKLVERLVSEPSYRDAKGRTLQDVIQGQDVDCWGVSVASVLAILSGSSTRPIDGVFTDCINGTIDADKLDYLIRDSIDCRVPYGKGIDVKRFLRTLTTTVQSGADPGECRAVLSVRRKGFAAIQTLALARYEMHCALYWHHTFRAAKSMILDAAARCLLAHGQGMLFSDIDAIYYEHVVCGTPWHDVASRHMPPPPKKRKKGEDTDVEVREEKIPRALERQRALAMLWRIGDAGARKLLESAVNPNDLYKRLFEVSVDTFPEQQRMKLREHFLGEGRVRTRKAVHESLHRALARAAQMRAETVSFKPDAVLAQLGELEKDDTTVTIDCPLRGWLPEGGRGREKGRGFGRALGHAPLLR